ncbi:unnamed protein product [Kuraishia capsulata CBS 1993]|uniref:Uncharacterized protein n=1 Tax=Kuraishia capsulata CBS 1993 TaxID=1382522 RepID=W6MJ21_9ASCO|nr:uncharacterized protein KUCA_T00000369001 [Kuraishia capsulata CBS 1993]CDK24407.1 unnamed protein product [Kuraishia capsulata CBS 1993]
MISEIRLRSLIDQVQTAIWPDSSKLQSSHISLTSPDAVNLSSLYEDIGTILREPIFREDPLLDDFIPLTIHFVTNNLKSSEKLSGFHSDDQQAFEEALELQRSKSMRPIFRMLANYVADNDLNRARVLKLYQPLFELIPQLLRIRTDVVFVVCHFVMNFQMDYKAAHAALTEACVRTENNLLDSVMYNLKSGVSGSSNEYEASLDIMNELCSLETISSEYKVELDDLIELIGGILGDLRDTKDDLDAEEKLGLLSVVARLSEFKNLTFKKSQMERMLLLLVNFLDEVAKLEQYDTAEILDRGLDCVKILSSNESLVPDRHFVDCFSACIKSVHSKFGSSSLCIILGNCVVSGETQSMVIRSLETQTPQFMSLLLETINSQLRDEKPNFQLYNSAFVIQKLVSNEKSMDELFSDFAPMARFKEMIGHFLSNDALFTYHKEVSSVLLKTLDRFVLALQNNSTSARFSVLFCDPQSMISYLASFIDSSRPMQEDDRQTYISVFLCKVLALLFSIKPELSANNRIIGLLEKLMALTKGQSAIPFPFVFERIKLLGFCLGPITHSQSVFVDVQSKLLEDGYESFKLEDVLTETVQLCDSLKNQPDGIPQQQVKPHTEALDNNLKFVCARVLASQGLYNVSEPLEQTCRNVLQAP